MRLRWQRHLAERDLILIADSAIDSAPPERDRAHLAACQRCSARLAAHRELARMLALSWAEARVVHRRPSVVSRFSLALPAVVLVVVLGGSVALRTFVAAPGTSLAPAGASPAMSPAGSPTAIVSPSAATLGPACPEGPSIAGSGAAPADAPTVNIVQPPRLDSVHWSPDGRHVLLAGGGVELLDGSGAILSTIVGAEAATWLDTETYATGSNCDSGSAVGSVTIHSLTGTQQVLAGTYDTTMLLGNGHGALALAPRAPNVADFAATTVVWAGSSLSKPVVGMPLAWSPDGGRLLVAGHPGGDSVTGGPDVQEVLVTWPGLSVAASLGRLRLDSRYDPVFSPDGRFIAIACAAPGDPADCGQYVANASTGASQSVSHQPPGLPLTWLSSGHLLLASATYGTSGPLVQWDGVGLVATNLAGVWGVSSSHGGVAVETAAMGDGGTTRLFDVSGTPVADLPGAIAVYWAPDGTHLLLRVDPIQDLILVRLK